jgi:vacuolar-type H+-ATPase subunit H
LLASEEQLASQLAAARAEAEQLLRDAREYAEKSDAACAATIDTRITELIAVHERQLETERRDIGSRAVREVARFHAIDAARERELVRLLLRGAGAFDAESPEEVPR